MVISKGLKIESHLRKEKENLGSFTEMREDALNTVMCNQSNRDQQMEHAKIFIREAA